MTKFVLRETLHQYFFVEAENEEEAISKLYDSELEPINKEYIDDVIVREVKYEEISS